MDKCTTEVRKQYWKGIVEQCQPRPQGQSAKAWLEENQICEQTYYLWQHHIRQEVFEEMNGSKVNVPTVMHRNEVAFAEIPMSSIRYNSNSISVNVKPY